VANAVVLLQRKEGRARVVPWRGASGTILTPSRQHRCDVDDHVVGWQMVPKKTALQLGGRADVQL